MGSLLKSALDTLFVDGHMSPCFNEIPEDVAGLGRLATVADICDQQPIHTTATSVSWRSQSTFMATADEIASI